MEQLLKEIINSDTFKEFHIKMTSNIEVEKLSFSYLGINYKGNRIISYKFYYVFFGLESIVYFPIPELEDYFFQYRSAFSSVHINTQVGVGNGITFTIKFDVNLNVSKGVYFRVVESSDNYIKLFLSKINLSIDDYIDFFDRNSHLKYLAIGQNGINTRNYIYCHTPSHFNQFDNISDIPFSNSDYIEISTDWEDSEQFDNMRFISLLTLPTQIKRIEDSQEEVKEIIYKLNLDLINDSNVLLLHGYYIFKNIKSVFIFQKNLHEIDLISNILK